MQTFSVLAIKQSGPKPTIEEKAGGIVEHLTVKQDLRIPSSIENLEW